VGAGAGLASEDVSRLACALTSTRTRLTSVSLANNRLDSESAALISEAVLKGPGCDGVALLDLSWNRIDSVGAGRLAEALRRCRTKLVSLNLECNDLQDLGIELLAPALRCCRSLRSLCLAGNRIGAKGVGSLATALPHCSLEELSLSRNYLGAHGAAALGAAFRAPASGSVTEDVAVPIVACPLRSLKIAVNRIGDSGAEALAEALTGPSCSWLKLECLDLGNNLIGDRGAFALAGMVAQSRAPLVSLNLARNRLQQAGAEELLKAMEHGHESRLQTLELHGNVDLGDSFFSRVVMASRRNCRSIVPLDPLQSALQMCKAGCYRVDLTGVHLGAHGMERLAAPMSNRRVRLSTLILNNVRLTDRDMQCLCDVLNHGFGIEQLDVSWNRLTAVGAESMSSALQAPGCPLVHLDLGYNSIGDDGARSFAFALESPPQRLTVPRGSPVHVDAVDVTDAHVANAERRVLRVLRLAGNGVGVAGAECLACALRHDLSALCELHLCSNRVGVAGAMSFANVLANPRRSLCTLDLNRLGDKGCQVVML